MTYENNLPYLELNPEIEETIRKDREHHWVNPYACRDEDIVRREEKPHDAASLVRPAFSRDIDKILNVAAYNRYAGKTQVFSFVENDEICRRGLHVQLVSRIARSLGELLGLNVDLIEAIALGHDVGHTPLGHAGERFLSTCYHKRTGRYFNHNVHSVRVLDKLYRRNISLQTLNGVICHNGEFAQQVVKTRPMESFGDLDSCYEDCCVDEQVIKTLRPSTLEGCVVRVSDMIAYIGKDRQDALEMGILDDLSAFHSEILGTDNARIINNLIVDIVNNSYRCQEIRMSKEIFEDLRLAKRENYEIIYDREGLRDNDKTTIADIFEEVYDRLLTDLAEENENSPIYRHHIANLCRQSRSITKESYLDQDPNQIVVDYIASMTDNYFMDLYDYLFPQSNKTIFTQRYFSDLSD
ncbi:MAG: deoxyguanosinetriphosphate triphosphohydrolase family protein [Eggerthellaceae bacterium]